MDEGSGGDSFPPIGREVGGDPHRLSSWRGDAYGPGYCGFPGPVASSDTVRSARRIAHACGNGAGICRHDD